MGDETVETVAPISLPSFVSKKCVLISWIASFCILIVLSFFIFIPIAMTMNDTEGNCFLYAHYYDFGPASVCSYCIACAVIFLSICGLRLIFLVLKIVHITTKVTDRMNMWFNIWGVHILILCLDVVLLVLLLVTSCLLSVGLSMMCHNLFQGREPCSSEYGVFLPSGKVYTSFYTALAFSEGSAWCTLIYWLLVTILETFLLWKDGSLRNVAVQAWSLVHREH